MKFLNRLWQLILFICFITVTVTWIALPDKVELNIGLSVLCLFITAGLIYPRRKVFYEFVFSRFFKKLLSNFITVFLTLSILAVINFMSYKKPTYWDISKQNINTLSDQTKKVLDEMKGELLIEYYGKRSSWDKGISILELYRGYKNDLIIKAYDIERQLYRAKSFGIKEDKSIRIVFQGRSLVTKFKSELSITNALFKVGRQKIYNIGLLGGHGELSLENKGKEGISSLLSHLKNATYKVKRFNLDKADLSLFNLILVLGPTIDFQKDEIDKLENYYSHGGNLVIALDPNFENKNQPMFRNFIFRNGFKILNNIVVDRLSTVEGFDASITLSKNFNKKHYASKGFLDKKSRVIFPLSSAIEFYARDGVSHEWLVQSNAFPAVWAEHDVQAMAKGKATYSDKDIKGPLVLAATIENSKYKNRFSLFGNSRFILDGYTNNSTNLNLFLNAISWSMKDEGIVSIDRAGLVQERIYMSNNQLNLIFYFSIVFTPLLLILISIFVYRRRLRL
jgi:ABC-2 type transport system permease protein